MSQRETTKTSAGTADQGKILFVQAASLLVDSYFAVHCFTGEAEAERDEAERTDLVITTSEAESGSGPGNDEVPRRQSQKM